MIGIDDPAAQRFLQLLDMPYYRRVIETALDTSTPVWLVNNGKEVLRTLTAEETQFLLAHWRLTHA